MPQCSGTPPESNRSLTTLTQPPGGRVVVVVELVVVAELVVVGARVVEVDADVVEVSARVVELDALVVVVGAWAVEVHDVSTTSCGASSPDSRLENRSPAASAVVTTRSTLRPPTTSGVTSTLVNMPARTPLAVATRGPG